MGVEIGNKKSGQSGQEHRGVPRTESQATPMLSAVPPCVLFSSRGFHDWRWVGWPLSVDACDERWCETCGLRQIPVNGEWVSNAACVGPPQEEALNIERLVLSIATNHFTVPLPTGKEVIRAVNAHDALVAACSAAMPVVNFYAQLLSDPHNREHYLKIGKQLRAALALATKPDTSGQRG